MRGGTESTGGVRGVNESAAEGMRGEHCVKGVELAVGRLLVQVGGGEVV